MSGKFQLKGGISEVNFGYHFKMGGRYAIDVGYTEVMPMAATSPHLYVQT